MSPGLVLTALSLVTTVANLAFHYPKIKANRASLRPRREQAIMVVALVLAAFGFVLDPGLVGYALGGVAVVPASLFLFATFNSGLPYQQAAVAVGALAPDFTARDADGREFRLSDRRGSPVLLKFYRGVWCPYCVGELNQLNGLAKDFAALGVSLIAVSSDRVEELRPFKPRHDWAVTLLADPTLAVHCLYNVQQRNFTPKRGPFRDLAIPTTMLIDKDGRVLLLEQSIDFRVRLQADAILAKTGALLSEGVPDAAGTEACDVCADIATAAIA
jgi:peroxiredoxin